jgi:hypothetical protein
MKRFEDGEWKKTVCAIGISSGGEFTLCGDDAVCAVREGKYNDKTVMEPIGKNFEGKLKDVTCEKCLSIIHFIKGLR